MNFISFLKVIFLTIFIFCAPILGYKAYYNYKVNSFVSMDSVKKKKFFKDMENSFLKDTIPYIFSQWNTEHYLEFATFADRLNNAKGNVETLNKAKQLYGNMKTFNGCDLLYAGDNRGNYYELDAYGAKYKCTISYEKGNLAIYLSVGTKHGQNAFVPIELFIYDIMISQS